MWDVIPLSWRSFLKFSLEMASIAFAVGPLMVFLRTNRFTDTVMATIVSLQLFVISLSSCGFLRKKCMKF